MTPVVNWEALPLAIAAYVLGVVAYFNALSILCGPGLSRRQDLWNGLRAVFFPIDIAGTVFVRALDAFRRWRSR